MPILWTCCHCGSSTRLPDVLDGMQGRCPKCRRYSIMQGAHVAEDEGSQAGMRAMAPESREDQSASDRQEAQFPLRDFHQTTE